MENLIENGVAALPQKGYKTGNVDDLNPLKPRDVHALWLLLKQAESISLLNAEKLAKEVFEYASKVEVLRLAKVGYSMGLLTCNKEEVFVKTSSGIEFSKSKHWRFWKPTKKALSYIGQQVSSNLFIDEEEYNNRPIVVDLFAGVGGLSLGFEAAGFNVKVAIDNDPQACEAHRLNFPDSIVIEGDITELASRPVDLICNANGIDHKKVVGVIGGPPCQGFSYMGERVTGDERNLLTSRFMDVVMGIEPDFFVMENVMGLLTSGALPKFGTYVRRLGKSIGEPASRIVERLPEANVALSKRDRQFRKKTVSKAVTAFRALLNKEFSGELSFELSVKVLASAFPRLQNWIIEQTAGAYQLKDYNSVEYQSIRSAILEDTHDVAQLALGLVVDILMERNHIVEKSAEDYIVKLGSAPDMPRAIKETIDRIAEEYDSAPRSEVFKGVTVGPILAHLINRASEKYNVTAPEVLNSAWYGTPQSRQRMFLVGIHNRVGKSFSFPEQAFTLPGVQNTISESSDNSPDIFNALIQDAPNVFEAIGDLPDIDKFEELLDGDKISAANLSSTPSQYAMKMRLESIESGDYSLPRPTWNPYVIDCSNRTIHTEEVIERLKQTSEGVQEETSHKTRLNRQKVSNTLRAGTKEGKGSHTAVRPVHYEYHRVISVREGGRIMGYPDWMMFHHTKWHGFRLVGNGVPFQLGNAVAKEILNTIKINSGE